MTKLQFMQVDIPQTQSGNHRDTYKISVL